MPDVTLFGSQVTLPSGWVEVDGEPGFVTLNMEPFPVTGSDYMERIRSLRILAHTAGVRVTVSESSYLTLDGRLGNLMWTRWMLDSEHTYWDSAGGIHNNGACHACGMGLVNPCNCERCGTSQSCSHCGVAGAGLTYDPHRGGTRCPACLSRCTECDELYGTYSNGLCRGCYERQVFCSNCSEIVDRDWHQEMNGQPVCDYCWDQRCESCETRYAEYGGLCYRCEDEQGDELVGYVEDFDYGIEDFTPLEFSFDRGRQRTSVEIEFGGDAEGVAAELFRQGLSPARSVGGYHSGMGRENNECAYVEEDGSISYGGELIISRLGLPEQSETRRLWQSLAVLRKRVRDGENKLTMQCGVHIHVDVSRYDLPWAMSAAVVYNFLERALYHIAAANWSSHRSSNGNSYSALTPKEVTNPNRFRDTFGYDRYYGLNASNYLGAIRRCECGNQDTGSLCTCRRYKCTLEFRLWNTTVNPRKLHAYIAICQAIVAFAKGKSLTVADLPAWEFDHTSKPSAEDAHEYARRLTWMFENLPFSPEERNSIRYCLRHCDLAQVLENSDVNQDTVHGILHNDELLDIPEFIAPREDEDQGERVTIPADAVPRFQTLRDRTPVTQDMNGRWHDAQGRFTYTPATPFDEYAERLRALEELSASLSTQVYEPATVGVDF